LAPEGSFSNSNTEKTPFFSAYASFKKLPSAGVLSSGGKGQLVLAGDPKQLGPILRSPIAIKFGLQLSLLERLMKQEIFGRGQWDQQQHTKTGENIPNYYKMYQMVTKYTK
jgi:helicase MOV-10